MLPRKNTLGKTFCAKSHYKSLTALSDMHHLTYYGISSLLLSVNLTVFTLLLVYLTLRISPHHSHHLTICHSLDLSLQLLSFTNSLLHSHSYSFRTAFTDLNLYWIKRALAFVYFSFFFLYFFWLRVLD